MEKEDLKDERNESGDNGNSAGGTTGGEQGSGDPGRDSGGSEGRSGGEQKQSGGTSEHIIGSNEGSNGSEGNNAKIDLLQRIRSQRANGQHKSSGSTDGTSIEHSEGNSKGNRGSKRGTKTDSGITSGNDRDIGRDIEQDDNSNGGTSETSQTNVRQSRIKDEKPQGVKVKGVDKIKELAQKAAKTEAPKLKFTWDDKALTNKEADEVLPKVKALLEFVFRHMDKGISISNRNKAQAHIWSAIDNEDIEIIASHLVEMGKASKIVATAVRRMTNSYRLLQIGLITLPKFIQTYQFYAENGGFALTGGK